MQLTDYTKRLLDDVERRIDAEAEDDFIAQWENFWDGKCEDIIFRPMRKKITAPGIELQNTHINDAVHDYELMLDMQMEGVSTALNSVSNALSIRADYGTGIMTSIFGAEIFEMPREMKTRPTTRSLNNSDAVRCILEKGIPDLNRGFGKDVFHFGEMCVEIFKDYPSISKYVRVYHPDTQGPLDIAELLWGSEMFYEMYDDPDFVHEVLDLITNTYIEVMDRWYRIWPDREGLTLHWNIMQKGAIMIRNDSAMNISSEMYGEFALPYDVKLLDYYKGGCVHYCGRGDHYIGQLMAKNNLYGVNLSQPHYNDMEKIFRETFIHNKKLLDMNEYTCREYAKREDAVRGMIHCATFKA